MTSNLPPGVTDSMIPGNRPEDVAQEKFMDRLYDLLSDFGIDLAEQNDELWEQVDTYADGLLDLIVRYQRGQTETEVRTCRYCQRDIIDDDGRWVDPNATGDDSVWRETCDAHNTFAAEHEPVLPT